MQPNFFEEPNRHQRFCFLFLFFVSADEQQNTCSQTCSKIWSCCWFFLPNIQALQFTTIIKTLRAHYAVVLLEKDWTIVSTKTLAFLVLGKFKWFQEVVKEWNIYKVARSLKMARIAPIEKRFKRIQARQMFLQPNNWHFLVSPLVSNFSCFLQIHSDILCLWM